MMYTYLKFYHTCQNVIIPSSLPPKNDRKRKTKAVAKSRGKMAWQSSRSAWMWMCEQYKV